MTNTTPLITLAGVGLLDLLPLLYGKVWAPRIVLDEDDFTPISLPISSRTLANNASPRHPYDWPFSKEEYS